MRRFVILPPGTAQRGAHRMGAIPGRPEAGALMGRTLAWLVPCLALWWLAASVVAWPAACVSRIMLLLLAGDARMDLGSHGMVHATLALFGTGHTPAPVVDLEANASIYTFGLAVFAALVLATHGARPRGRIAIAAAAILLVPSIGLTAEMLMEMGQDARLAPLLGWSGGVREAIGLAYQVGCLLLPTLAPVAAWLWVYPRLWYSGATPP